MFSFNGFTQSQHSSDHVNVRPSQIQLDSILTINITPAEQADRFGHLVVQDTDGRMKPINTYASELLRKLSKKDNYKGFDANQVFLSMQESPQLWYNVPLIFLKDYQNQNYSPPRHAYAPGFLANIQSVSQRFETDAE